MSQSVYLLKEIKDLVHSINTLVFINESNIYIFISMIYYNSKTYACFVCA